MEELMNILSIGYKIITHSEHVFYYSFIGILYIIAFFIVLYAISWFFKGESIIKDTSVWSLGILILITALFPADFFFIGKAFAEQANYMFLFYLSSWIVWFFEMFHLTKRRNFTNNQVVDYMRQFGVMFPLFVVIAAFAILASLPKWRFLATLGTVFLFASSVYNYKKERAIDNIAFKH